MAFALLAHRPSRNWFLTWDADSVNDGKCFLLQIKLFNLVHRQNRNEGPNVYAIIYRRHNGAKTFTKIGTTSIIKDDRHPEFPDGFRIYFDQQTDLSDDLLKIICFHRRELPPSHEYVLGAATITIRELVRTFGARVNVELIRQGSQRVAGGVWFYAEALPVRSPRGGSNVIQFSLSVLPPRRSEIRFQSVRMFLVVERERSDRTWSVVYHSDVYKHEGMMRLTRKPRIRFDTFQVRQGELILGMTALRKIRISFLQKGKRTDPHLRIGEVTTSVEELITDFQVDCRLDLCLNSNVVGNFINVGRMDEDTCASFNVDVNFFPSGANLERRIVRRQLPSTDIKSACSSDKSDTSLG